MSGGKELRALSGIAAGAVGLGVAQLMAVPSGPAADSLSTVGSAVIDLTPGGVKEWPIHMVAVIIAIAAGAGTWERPGVPVGSIAVIVAGVAGCARSLPHLVALVRAGAVFHKGKLLERPVDITPVEPDESHETEVA